MENVLIVDGHLDLAMNAMEWNRDLSQELDAIRSSEANMKDKPDRGRGTVCLPELRKGKVGLVVATQIARVAASGSSFSGWRSASQAWAMTQAQLSWYREMEKRGEMKQITNVVELDEHLALWNDASIADDKKPVGYILSLEGADSLVDISYLHTAYEYGLRAVGLSHFAHGRYAPGTKMQGEISAAGIDLLKSMDDLNIILDVTHLTDEGFFQAMDVFKGAIWASHCNVRKLVPTQRQLTDEQIKMLINRGSVIGGMLDCWALDLRFIDTISDPWQLDIRMERIVEHWDHICQIAGNSQHVAIGSDLDGIFGTEQSPWDMNSIADLQKYKAILLRRGYKEEDVRNIFHENWIRFIRNAWQ